MTITTPKKIGTGCDKLTALASFIRAAATRPCTLGINMGKGITDAVLSDVMFLQV